jgi:hypothetical protein
MRHSAVGWYKRARSRRPTTSQRLLPLVCTAGLAVPVAWLRVGPVDQHISESTLDIVSTARDDEMRSSVGFFFSHGVTFAMPRLSIISTVAVITATLLPRLALGGMPSVTFSDIARLRLQTISFFLMGLLLSAAVTMAIWNSLRRDFIWLPHLSYAKSFGLVTLWGLLFIIVLTMISGARELMTPGAWERNGLTYRLGSTETTEDLKSDHFQLRRDKLLALGKALREYADKHNDQYPASTNLAADIPTTAWDLKDLPGRRYIYIPGRRSDDVPSILAYEPDVYSYHPQVLFTDGTVQQMGMDEILRTTESKP